MQPRRNDLGVIEDDQIAGPEMTGQIFENAGFLPLRIRHEQPRGTARPRRAQRDQVFRKIEIEVIDAHRALLSGAPPYSADFASSSEVVADLRSCNTHLREMRIACDPAAEEAAPQGLRRGRAYSSDHQTSGRKPSQSP